MRIEDLDYDLSEAQLSGTFGGGWKASLAGKAIRRYRDSKNTPEPSDPKLTAVVMQGVAMISFAAGFAAI